MPTALRPTFIEMDAVAELIVSETGAIIAGKNADGAGRLSKVDDQMDDLHKQVFALLRDEELGVDTATAIDITLLARYYERFADHAVLVAQRVAFLVTGQWQPVPSGT